MVIRYWDSKVPCCRATIKLGLRICNSFADFSGKPSSDNDIQLMVYSIRE